MYSDFRSQKTTNPDGYQANVATWRQGLANAVLAGKVHGHRHATKSSNTPSKAAPSHLVLHSGPNLVEDLKSKQFGRPLALGTVIREATADGTLVPLSQFLARDASIYDRAHSSSSILASWGSSLPGALLWWTVRHVTSYGDPTRSEDSIPTDTFAIVPNLESAARAFQSRIAISEAAASVTASPFERTFSRAHFECTFRDVLSEEGDRVKKDIQRMEVAKFLSSSEDMDVFLKFLSRDKGLIVTDGRVVRILASSTTDVSWEITEEDYAIASLRDLMLNLEHQISMLEARFDSLDTEARAAVARRNMAKALAILKSKKHTECLLKARYATLAQLHEVARKLEQAADQVQLIRVMQSSASALHSLNKRTGGADHVVDVLNDLREQMGEVDEIGRITTDLGPATVVVDEDEIDDELEALERDKQEKEEEEREKRNVEEGKKAKALEERLAEAEPPSARPIHSLFHMKDEVELEALANMRKMSLVNEAEDKKDDDRSIQATQA